MTEEAELPPVVAGTMEVSVFVIIPWVLLLFVFVAPVPIVPPVILVKLLLLLTMLLLFMTTTLFTLILLLLII